MEKTRTSIEKFDTQNGKVARIIVIALAGPPFAICSVLGMAIGAVLAVPGLAIAALAAVPHWLSSGSK